MSARLAARSAPSAGAALALGLLGVCLLAMWAPPPSRASGLTAATITPVFTPDRLGAKGAITLTVSYSDPFGVPSPVRRALVRFPAGLSLDIPSLRSCSAARLRSLGARGCPAQSQLGSGHALVEAEGGSQLITENIALRVFLGALQSNFEPTVEVLGEGVSPLQERVVLSGSAVQDHAPYGEDLLITVPPIPTLPLEPDASLLTLTLTVGAHTHRLARDANTVVMPGSCPAGGFPFAAEFTYADGSTGDALATALCPR
jgi:hypothetical protein